MDELEQLLQLTGKSHPKHLGPILRVAWDCGDWGQIRVSSEAVNGTAKLNLKLHANTTPEKASTFFSSMLTDGTFDLITFTTITEKGRPVYGDFGAEYAESVRKLTLPLEMAHGKYVCEEALSWAIRMEEEQEALAEEMDCRAYEGLYPRAIQNAFYRAMTLYLANGRRRLKNTAHGALSMTFGANGTSSARSSLTHRNARTHCSLVRQG